MVQNFDFSSLNKIQPGNSPLVPQKKSVVNVGAYACPHIS